MKEQKSTKTGEVVLKIDEHKKRIEYILFSQSSQRKHFSKILIRGFTKRPSGFYADGYGLTKDGQYVLRALAEELGEKFDLEFSKDDSSAIRKTSKKYIVRIKHGEYAQLLEELRQIRADRNRSSKLLTSQTLAKWFPRKFKVSGALVKREFEYEDDKISKILNSETDLVAKLSKNDITRILEIYPTLVDQVSERAGKAANLEIISSSKKAADKIVLAQLIREFEKKLKQQAQSENAWQQFLQKHILLFNTSYVGVLGKASVSLQGKYPDFMLVDVFNYVDIFEIKKPTTNLLKKDESRNNYYWDIEISKAISQVENYISSLSTNGANFSQEVRKLKGLDVSIVRPRGIIIAGSRDQLTTEKMRDDFRLLRNSLANIDVVLFDDFLNRLKNLEKRLKKNAD